MSRGTPEQRFWAKVDSNDECWEWKAGKVHNGYGQFRVSTAVTVYAHRFAYELLIGPIPADMTIDHRCRNKACVNPAHLEPVTNAENIRRTPRNAHCKAKSTHCRRGHPWTPENTRPGHKGTVMCRACGRENNAKYRARKAAA